MRLLMPWDKTREDRRRDDRVYKDPEYLRNRTAALRRAGGRCECQGCKRHEGPCARRDRRLQVDHIRPVSVTGTPDHSLGNLQVLCNGPGSCHAAKTATEGAGYRQPKSDPKPLRRTAW